MKRLFFPIGLLKKYKPSKLTLASEREQKAKRKWIQSKNAFLLRIKKKLVINFPTHFQHDIFLDSASCFWRTNGASGLTRPKLHHLKKVLEVEQEEKIEKL